MTDILLAALIYLIPTFPLGYVWHLHLYRERYAALGVYRATVSPPLGFASMVIQGLAFGLVYTAVIMPLAASWPLKGLAYAALGGLLSWSFTTVAAAAKSPMTSIPAFVAIESGFTAVQWLVVGLLTAALLG